jgi:hypothetical protein
MAWNQKQLDELLKNGASGVRVISKGNPAPASVKKAEKRSKYNAIPVPDPEDGTTIDSKLEAKHRKEYRAMLKAGLLTSYSRQPEFVLAGGIKYVSDHDLHYPDGRREIVDSKGIQTTDFKMKMKLMKEAHPNITVIIRSK